jgi:hypothetical protein
MMLDLDALTERHIRRAGFLRNPDVCEWDRSPWPCDESRLLVELRAARAVVEASMFRRYCVCVSCAALREALAAYLAVTAGAGEQAAEGVRE